MIILYYRSLSLVNVYFWAAFRREMAELQRVYKRDCFVLEEKMRKWQQFDSQALGNVNKDSQILSEVQMGTFIFT
jgi:hypothetical protein